MWGGLVPDSLMTLARLIATLHDDEGNVAVEGLYAGPAADVDYPEARLRAESGALARRPVDRHRLERRAALDPVRHSR